MWDLLDLLSKELEPEDEVEFFVIDFKDAFWQVPLRPEERRFFTARLREEWYIFLRLAQGSRGGNTSLGEGGCIDDEAYNLDVFA